MPINDPVKQQILDKADIVDTVGQYVQLQTAGRGRFKGLCPFHNEKTPSFHVDVERGFYHCFGCGVGGNVIDFIMGVENLTYSEARRMMAERHGIELPSYRPGKRKHDDIDRYQVMDAAARYYQQALKTAKPAIDYLKKRGLTGADVKRFGIGYAPGGWDNLLFALKKQNIPETVMADLGLILRRQQGDGYYDRFRNRIMFPIRNTMGRVIAFGGRAMDPDDPAKYLNSNETELFNKSKTLYLLDQAKQVIKERGAIAVEGYMDAIALHRADLTQAVATLGTSLTEEHIHMLRRYTDRFTLLYDGDEAGVRAALRAVELFFSQSAPVSVITLPDGLDPDDFISQHGADAMNALIDEAPDGFAFTLNHVMQDKEADTPQGKNAIVEGMVPLLARVPERFLQHDYVRLLAERIGADAASLQQTIDKKSKQARPSGAVRQTPPPQGANAAPEPQDPNRLHKETLLRLLAFQHGLTMPDGMHEAEKPWLFEDADWTERLPGLLKNYGMGSHLDRLIGALIETRPSGERQGAAARLDSLFADHQDVQAFIRIVEAETLPNDEKSLRKMRDDVMAHFDELTRKREWDALRSRSGGDPKEALKELDRILFSKNE